VRIVAGTARSMGVEVFD
ncbi:MAG: hypothetical protein ACE5PT_10325, partial [Gemmatimonadales bacterium]